MAIFITILLFLSLKNACVLKSTQIYYLILSHRVKIGDGPSQSSLQNFSSQVSRVEPLESSQRLNTALPPHFVTQLHCTGLPVTIILHTLFIKGIHPLIKRINSQQYRRTEYAPLDVICIIRSSNPNRRVSSLFQESFGGKSVFDLKSNSVFSYIGPPNSQLRMKSVCMMTIDIHKDLHRNNLQETPLHIAVTNGNLEGVKFLVQQNITIEGRLKILMERPPCIMHLA